ASTLQEVAAGSIRGRALPHGVLPPMAATSRHMFAGFVRLAGNLRLEGKGAIFGASRKVTDSRARRAPNPQPLLESAASVLFRFWREDNSFFYRTIKVEARIDAKS